MHIFMFSELLAVLSSQLMRSLGFFDQKPGLVYENLQMLQLTYYPPQKVHPIIWEVDRSETLSPSSKSGWVTCLPLVCPTCRVQPSRSFSCMVRCLLGLFLLQLLLYSSCFFWPLRVQKAPFCFIEICFVYKHSVSLVLENQLKSLFLSLLSRGHLSTRFLTLLRSGELPQGKSNS